MGRGAANGYEATHVPLGGVAAFFRYYPYRKLQRRLCGARINELC